MKKKIGIMLVAIFAVTMFAATFTACANSSPEAVVRASIKAVNEGKNSKMLDYYYFESDLEKELAAAFFVDVEKPEEQIEAKNFKTEKDGDKATVTFETRIKGSNDEWEEESVSCIKKGGKWYIDAGGFGF